MRIAQLHLTRYGHFTDATFDFGPPRASDVTIIYGDNEAGKSTLFNAWLDLLFGIPARKPPYAFRHTRAQLEIGARVETAQGTQHFLRTGRGLFDGDGRPLEEMRLKARLPSPDREDYKKRFSLDDRALREGGEEIAAAKGDLGQALHVGSSGLGGVGKVLDGVRDTVEAFHMKGGRRELAKAKLELAELSARIREDELTPPRFDALQATLEDAEAEADAATNAAQTAAQEVLLCQTALDLRDIAAARETLEARLADMPEGPPLPTGAEGDLREAITAQADAAEATAEAKRQIAAAQAVLDDTAPDPGGMVLAAEVARITALTLEDGTSLLARAEANRADLPRRKDNLTEAEAERDAALAQAGLIGPLPFEATQLDELESLLPKAEQAQNDLDRLRDTHDREAAAVPTKPPAPLGKDALEGALAAIPDPSYLADRRDAAQTAREAASTAAATLPAGWDALCTGLPEEADAQALVDALRDAKAAVTTARATLDTARADRDAARDIRDAAMAQHDAVTDADRIAARTARDGAWETHRATLDAATADTFRTAMRHDDAIAERFARGAEARAALTAAEAELSRKEARVSHAEAALEAAENATKERKALFNALAKPLQVKDPGALMPRIRRLRDAIRADISARAAETRAQQAENATSVALGELVAALKETGVTPGGDLRRQASDRLKDLVRAETAVKLHQEAAKRVEKAAERLAAGKVTAKASDAALRTALTGTEMEPWPLDRLRESLPALRRALQAEGQRRDLAARIDTITAALDRLEAEAAALDVDGDDAFARLSQARIRGDAALAADEARKNAKMARDAGEAALARCESRAKRAQAEIDRIFKDQGGTGPARDRLATLLERDGTRAELAALDQREASLRNGVDAKVLATALTHANAMHLSALQTKQAEAEEAVSHAREAVGAAREARRAALAATGAGAPRQARVALLEELRPKARHAAALMLGEAAARRALDRHQEENRGQMLNDAGAAFARLTDGAWTRLETGPGEKGEALFAVGPAGRVPVQDLSTGTRGQVYLALRLAGYSAFVETSGPLPFVLDDIAETFDDTRARATLTMLGELGARGQAILLTHHWHLVELARAALPAVRVIELPGRSELG